MKRPLATLFPLVLLCLGLFTGYLFLNRDLAKVNDAELTLQTVSIPKDQNSFFDIQNLTGKVIGETEYKELRGAGIKDQAVAKQIVDRNREAINQFLVAAGKPTFQDPVMSDPAAYRPNLSPTNLSPLTAVTSIIERDAQLKALNGDLSGASTDVEAVIRFGNHMAQSQGSFLTYLEGTSILKTGFEAARDLNLDTKSLAHYAQTSKGAHDALIIGYVQDHSAFDSLDTLKRHLNNDFFGDSRAGDTLDPFLRMPDFLQKFYYQPNRTKQIMADWAKLEAEYAASDCKGSLPTPSDAQFKEIARVPTWKIYLTPNYIGRMVLSVTLTEISSSTKRRRCDIEKLAEL